MPGRIYGGCGRPHGGIQSPSEKQYHKISQPMIGDFELLVSKLYGMLPAKVGEACEGSHGVG